MSAPNSPPSPPAPKPAPPKAAASARQGVVRQAATDQAHRGTFTRKFYREILEGVAERGLVCTLTVSTGVDERVFFFTRGAVLFVAVGVSGGEILARKLVARGLASRERLDPIIARANKDVPLLQDILVQESVVPAERMQTVVEDVTEDHLVEVALWEGALYDYNPGNPPTRIYGHEMPAVRLSIGAKPLLARVLAKLPRVDACLSTLGGSLSSKVARNERGGSDAGLEADERAVLEQTQATGRSAREILAKVASAGLPPLSAAQALASLVQKGRLVVDPEAVLTRPEELEQAGAIEKEFGRFVARHLSRMHLATIYERIGDDRAVEQYRAIAEEHLSQDRINEGLEALRNVVRLQPLDVPARELTLKIFRSANRLEEAKAEAVELAKVYLQLGLPGRARQAFMLTTKLVPRSKGVLWMLGGLLRKLGERESAIKRFEELAQCHGPGEREGALAAWQQVLELDKRHKAARLAVGQLSGYNRALGVRLAVSAGIVILFAIVYSWGIYQMSAKAAFSFMSSTAYAAIDEARYQDARTAAADFKKSWRLAITAAWTDRIVEEAAQDERIEADLVARARIREAERLVNERRLPVAVEAFRMATHACDPALVRRATSGATEIDRELAQLEDRLSSAKDLAAYAGTADRGHEMFQGLLDEAPWFAARPDFTIPLRVETRPAGAFLQPSDGPRAGPTPVTIWRRPGASSIDFEGADGEHTRVAVPADAAWPLSVTLRRHPIWRAPGVAATSAPCLVAGVVVTAGLDRTVTAVDAESGRVRWKTTLEAFDECSLPLARLGQDAVALRTASGTVVALDASTGAVRWRRDVPPPDATDRKAAAPLGVPGGLAVREGATKLTLLDATGTLRWSEDLGAPLVGMPVLAGNVLVVETDRSLAGVSLADGKAPWRPPAFARPPVSEVAAGAGGAWVVLAGGSVAGVDPAGRILSSQDTIAAVATGSPLVGDARRLVVGTTAGEVVMLQPGGKLLWRTTLQAGSPVRWLRLVSGLVLAGDEHAVYALETRKGTELWCHGTTRLTPAFPSEARVYVADEEGLAALARSE